MVRQIVNRVKKTQCHTPWVEVERANANDNVQLPVKAHLLCEKYLQRVVLWILPILYARDLHPVGINARRRISERPGHRHWRHVWIRVTIFCSRALKAERNGYRCGERE
jgi:hypothetical protein